VAEFYDCEFEYAIISSVTHKGKLKYDRVASFSLFQFLEQCFGEGPGFPLEKQVHGTCISAVAMPLQMDDA
jgi:hypothetical protein